VNLDEDITALRQHLDELARIPDEALEGRYAMQRPLRPQGLYWQLRWLAGRVLRGLESLAIFRSDPWPVRLKHAGKGRRAKPLLVWAVGVEQDTLREACHGLFGLLEKMPGFAPVLVTDVADFAFFSRLAWLVEYLPGVEGVGESFGRRKERLVARLYRGAPAVPVSLGLASSMKQDEIRRSLL
jgi:hypothetical protein